MRAASFVRRTRLFIYETRHKSRRLPHIVCSRALGEIRAPQRLINEALIMVTYDTRRSNDNPRAGIAANNRHKIGRRAAIDPSLTHFKRIRRNNARRPGNFIPRISRRQPRGRARRSFRRSALPRSLALREKATRPLKAKGAERERERHFSIEFWNNAGTYRVPLRAPFVRTRLSTYVTGVSRASNTRKRLRGKDREAEKKRTTTTTTEKKGRRRARKSGRRSAVDEGYVPRTRIR